MEITLSAKKRDESLKPKQLRKQGWVPGCVYGKGMEPVNIQIPYQKLKNCLKKHAHTLQLDVEGVGEYFVGVDEVQKGALGDTFNHISFHQLNKNEKTSLTVEFHFEGKAYGQTEGGMINHLMHEVTIKGYPQDLPDTITVNVSELNVGDLIYIKDIADNYSFEFHPEDMDKAIVKCQYAKVVELPTATTEEPAAEETTEEVVAEQTDEKIAA